MFGLFKPKPRIMTPQRAEKVVTAFGKCMMDKPTMICDELDLPYSKAEIKEAIKVWLKIEPRKEVAEMLRASYVSLADYLPLTPREKATVTMVDTSNRQMPNPSDRASLSAYIKGFEGYHLLTQRVADEAKVLMAEIAVAPVWDGKTIPDHARQ